MISSTQQAPRRAVDAERWPDVAVAEGSAVRAAVARALFTRAVAALPITVRFPDGRQLGPGGPAAPVMVLHRPHFGPHYAETLKIWRDRFQARAHHVTELGFDDVFTRMWTFYLCYSEAGFRSGYIGVSQLTLARA